MLLRCFLTLYVLLGITQPTATAAQPVDGKLVVAIDGSASLQGEEDIGHNVYGVQFVSTVTALQSNEVRDVIAAGHYGCIGLTIFTWSAADPTRNHGHPLYPRKGNQRHLTVLPWKRWCANDPAMQKSFEEITKRVEQFYIGSSTSISAALLDAGSLCDNAPFGTVRCVIDLSANEVDNDPLPGMNIQTVRAKLEARHHQINGLPLVSSENSALEAYFLENVATADGFALTVPRADPANSMLRAFIRKFAIEIAQL